MDVGEAAPRQVVSGLVKYIPEADMANRGVVLVCNLKPAAMRGVQSQAMVLAATSPDGATVSRWCLSGAAIKVRTCCGRVVEVKSNGIAACPQVELVEPPEGVAPGERVFVDGYAGEPDEQLNPRKKVWDQVRTGWHVRAKQGRGAGEGGGGGRRAGRPAQAQEEGLGSGADRLACDGETGSGAQRGRGGDRVKAG